MAKGIVADMAVSRTQPLGRVNVSRCNSNCRAPESTSSPFLSSDSDPNPWDAIIHAGNQVGIQQTLPVRVAN